ncbi:MAG: hypothetical protein HOP95_09300 [Sphingomonas sp.]|nr:hypothetical protein [Sphingomonas sp.]
MRKLPAFALAGVAAAALAGTALAAAPETHVMNVPLPDGAVGHVQYIGNVAPKITIAQGPVAAAETPWAMPFPSFAGLGQMIEEMQRQSQAMMRQAQAIAHQPAGAAPYIASYGNLPVGGTSTTVISVSNGGATCTRTTQVVSQGPGKAPKVTSNLSGQCGSAGAPPAGAANPA